MFGKSPHLNPLAARKRVLIAQSELNRDQLVGGWVTLTEDVHTLTGRAKSFGSMASSAAVLVTGLAALRKFKTGNAGTKASWPQTILQGAGLVSTLWLAFRSRRREPTSK